MDKKILLVAINAKYIHSNLAVYSIRAYAERYKENIFIEEYTINNQVEDILDDIYRAKPDVIAFSCYIWNIEYVCKLMPELHKLLPECHIWLGGPEVSYNTDYYLDRYEFIKGILVGEGEETFKELVSAYYEVGSADDIEGTIDGMAGICTRRVRKCASRPCLDMSKLIFPYEDLTSFENRIIYYESSRGCPFSCSYCLSSIDKQLRFKPMDMVERELSFFLNNKVKQVKFIDRTFNCDRDRSLRIWRYINDHDNGVTNFHFEISADLITDEHIEILSKMRAGLIQLEIGVQSTNMDTISAIRRKMNIDKLKNVVALLRREQNIHIHLDLIAGLPYEDISSFRRSFNDVYSMKPHELQLGFLKVLHGSYMYDDAKEYSIVYKEFPPYEVLHTPWLTYDDVLLLKSVEEVVEIYYCSGQFTYTVKYLERFFDSPFDFYAEYGVYYAKACRKGEKHARIKRYDILLDFAKEKAMSAYGIDVELLKEIMTFDVYLRENIKTRPAFARDLSMHWQEIKEFREQHNIAKSNHVEIFSGQMSSFMADFNISEAGNENDGIYVLFDYENRSPINGNGLIKVINRSYL